MSDPIDRLRHALTDRYDVEREVGHGGMATVYLARDVRHGRMVAIKLLRPELAAAVGAARFLREINIAAQLQSPYVLPLLDSGESDGLLYYVMPFIAGDSLRARLAKSGALAPSEVVRLLRDMVDGLATAHRAGVVHRDMKPDNVMLSDRHAIVMDFGVAKAMSDASSGRDLTSIGFSMGTPTYMAPEQALADPQIDHRVDIYAIGVMAYELLTGAPPFTGTPQQVVSAHITRPPVPLGDVRADVPPALAAVVMRCLAKDPAERYQSADALLEALDALQTPVATTSASVDTARGAARPPRKSPRTAIIGGALAVVGIAAVAILAVTRGGGDRRWVEREGRPLLRRLVEAGEIDSAWTVALRIDSLSPQDSALAHLPGNFLRRVVIRSRPEGAKVYRASFNDTSRWVYLGTTPTDSLTLPNRGALYRYEKPGHRPLVLLGAINALLDAEQAPHAEMVHVPGGTMNAFLVGTDGNGDVTLGDYWLDRFEVSNREFKKFVDAGGYRDPQYWEPTIRDGDRVLPFAEAMARFVDRTGRPGPATWEGGDFPVGQGDLPVGGVSWYEAKAYARFVGKSLPTIVHWANAARISSARFIVPFSNIGSTAARPVGTPRGVSFSGASDMAGNVREWCENSAGNADRFILGGGWSDPDYSFVDAHAQREMNRADINGIRLAKYAADEPQLAQAARPYPRAFRDYTREQVVSDAVFSGFRPQFEYDPSPLATQVELRDSTTYEEWRVEKVTIAAAYGSERMAVWVYIPKTGSPPYQTIVAFPGSGVIGAAPYTGAQDPRLQALAASGRAIVYPIYKSTHERSDSLHSDVGNESIFWRDHVVMWVKDFRRTLDYLETRRDIDLTKLAYFGFSWGGNMAPVVLANEPRVKTGVLYVAGLTMEKSRAEVDPFHFLPRVRIPILMLNGRYDFFFPSKTSQEPFFKGLGAPAADKRYVVYEGGHDVPRTQFIRESLAWLDKYLGPLH